MAPVNNSSLELFLQSFTLFCGGIKEGFVWKFCLLEPRVKKSICYSHSLVNSYARQVH